MTVALSTAPVPSTALPEDYLERVYAGVLGKLIGVYLGRPIEGWTYERISREIGEVQYYLHQQLGVPLVVTDDDVTGTFAFLRALEEQPDASISARQIGEGWINTIIRGKTILWWGGRGMSTEHTAYLNLERGIDTTTREQQASTSPRMCVETRMVWRLASVRSSSRKFATCAGSRPDVGSSRIRIGGRPSNAWARPTR